LGAAQDLTVKLALALTAFHTSILRHQHPFRETVLVVRSRQVRVAGIAKTMRVCLDSDAIPLPGAQTAVGIDRERHPPRAAITIQLASPARQEVACAAGHGLQAFPSLYWIRARS
jgi:hypothetical protein